MQKNVNEKPQNLLPKLQFIPSVLQMKPRGKKTTENVRFYTIQKIEKQSSKTLFSSLG